MARFYESTSRGQVFSACTAAAGITRNRPGIAPPFWLVNPANSGIAVVLLTGSFGYISGTLGVGFVVLAGDTAGTITASGTVLAAAKNRVAAAPGLAKPYTTPTLSGTPVLLEPVLILPAFVGGAGVPTPPLIVPFDGRWVVPPGSSIGFQGIATAGTSPRCFSV